MRACTTASGGVLFIPDDIERKKTDKVSYDELVKGKKAKAEAETSKKLKRALFGKRKKKEVSSKAA